MGTANLGPWSSAKLDTFPYSQMRSSQRSSPIFYELGPRKSRDKGDTDDQARAKFRTGLENCTKLGCDNVVVWTENLEQTPNCTDVDTDCKYVPGSPHLAECASYDVFKVPANPPASCK